MALNPTPRPGVRHAAICKAKINERETCNTREFFESREDAERWRCGVHGQGQVQENRPYFGQDTTGVPDA